jgi:hypothetical protein
METYCSFVSLSSFANCPKSVTGGSVALLTSGCGCVRRFSDDVAVFRLRSCIMIVRVDLRSDGDLVACVCVCACMCVRLCVGVRLC